MNSPEYTYAIQSSHFRASVPGTGGYVLLSYPTRSTRPPQFVFDANYSSPTPLVYTEEEGSNTPLHSRFTLGKELPPHLKELAKSKKNQALIPAAWGLGITFPLFTAAPDTTPLEIKDFTDMPQYLFAKRRILRTHAALSADDDVRESDPKRMPAGAYYLNSCDLLSKVQAHLLETPDHGISFDSGQWSQEEALRYLNDRLNHFIERTGLIRKVGNIFAQQGVNLYDLPADLLELNRAAVLTSGSFTPLNRIDKFALDAGYPGWPGVTGTPVYIIEEPLEYLKLQLYPTPATNTLLEIVYTPAFNISNDACDPLPVPAMFEPYIMWGVVADMLKREGEMHDPERAEYASQRYEEGIQLALLVRGDG